MQGYIAHDLATLEHKRILAEEKAREIAIQHGISQQDEEVASALFEISKSLINDDYYAFSFRDNLPHHHYAEIEDHAGLVLVDIPDEYFTLPPVPE